MMNKTKKKKKWVWLWVTVWGDGLREKKQGGWRKDCLFVYRNWLIT